MWIKRFCFILPLLFSWAFCAFSQEDAREEIVERLTVLKVKLISLNEQTENLKAELARQESLLKEQEKSIDGLKADNESLRQEIESLRNQIADLEKLSKEYKEEAAKLSESLTKFSASSLKEKIEVGVISGLICAIIAAIFGYFAGKN